MNKNEIINRNKNALLLGSLGLGLGLVLSGRKWEGLKSDWMTVNFSLLCLRSFLLFTFLRCYFLGWVIISAGVLYFGGVFSFWMVPYSVPFSVSPENIQHYFPSISLS
jgi:hypothetical protein